MPPNLASWNFSRFEKHTNTNHTDLLLQCEKCDMNIVLAWRSLILVKMHICFIIFILLHFSVKTFQFTELISCCRWKQEENHIASNTENNFIIKRLAKYII